DKVKYFEHPNVYSSPREARIRQREIDVQINRLEAAMSLTQPDPENVSRPSEVGYVRERVIELYERAAELELTQGREEALRFITEGVLDIFQEIFHGRARAQVRQQREGNQRGPE